MKQTPAWSEQKLRHPLTQSKTRSCTLCVPTFIPTDRKCVWTTLTSVAWKRPFGAFTVRFFFQTKNRLQLFKEYNNFIRWINRYPPDKNLLFGVHFIRCWAAIYPLDKVIHCLNNRAHVKTTRTRLRKQ